MSPTLAGAAESGRRRTDRENDVGHTSWFPAATALTATNADSTGNANGEIAYNFMPKLDFI